MSFEWTFNKAKSICTPLRPHWIHALQREFPDLEFSLNGGVKSLDEVERFLECDASTCECSQRPLLPCSVPRGKSLAEQLSEQLDSLTLGVDSAAADLGDGAGLRLSGVMLGRAAMQTPWMFADADRRIFGDSNPGLTRRQIVGEYTDYIESIQDRYGFWDGQKGKGSGGIPVSDLVRPLLNLFFGRAGEGGDTERP